MNARSARAALFLVAVSFLALPAGAAPNAKYLVFSVDRSGSITLESSSLVTLDAALESDVLPLTPGSVSLASTDSRDGIERVFCDVVDSAGTVVFRRNVSVQRTIRAEWTDPVSGETRFKSIELDRTAFVVRVPATRSDTLIVTSERTRKSQRFDIRAPREPNFRLTADPVVGSDANSANRLDLLIVGDGYRTEEATKFEDDAANFVSTFTTLSPYSDYANYFNFTTLFVPSNQSGADHPVCSDPGKNPDPAEGRMVDTALDATFCSFGTQRLLTVNFTKTLTAARARPNWDFVMVLVNDTFYGGAGGIFSVASMHRDSTLIAQHEFGHTFGQLGDEYFAAGNVSSPLPCTDKGGSAQCPPNFTDETSRSSIKWGAWIAASTPIPTPASDQVHVGLFEGAGYLPTRLYRPKSNCAMRALGAPFCEVCKQTFVLRLYSGWGAAGGGAGSPANGVDVIEPGSETPSTATTINAVAGVPIDFAFALLKPVRGDAPIVQWSIDNAPISGATATTFHYIPTAGTHTVRVTVTDPTTAVHSAYAGSTLTRSRAWSVTAPACVATATRLCFVNNRYAVTVTATDSGRSGKSGDGEANVETADTGYFTLPALTGSRDNPEVVVKIVEVAPGQPWVFFGGLTDLEYAITVTDTQTGNVRVYRKPAGSVQNGFDVGSGQLPAPETTPGTVCPLLPLSVARSQQPPAPCAAGTSALCLAGNRFQVRVTAADTGRTNKSGPGLPRPKNDVFGFFSVPALTGNANNQEIFVKVIDGRGLNGKFWIFFGTLSDFEFTVEVLDTISGQVTTYTRPPGTACGAADTAAFPF